MIKSVTKFLSANYGVYACRSFSSSSSGLIETYIAIGSNVGDRVGAFKDAIAQLRLLGEVKSTSFLYETPPMYVTDQEKFLNAACHLRTSLRPEQLLSALQSIGMFMWRRLFSVDLISQTFFIDRIIFLMSFFFALNIRAIDR
jgi:2-amino-4-hydroxy-6-hydroxymethyldihydropteridine diphosphokinase